VEVVASLSQGRTAAAQCGLFTHKSVPVIFEPPCRIYHTNSFHDEHISIVKILTIEPPDGSSSIDDFNVTTPFLLF